MGEGKRRGDRERRSSRREKKGKLKVIVCGRITRKDRKMKSERDDEEDEVGTELRA